MGQLCGSSEFFQPGPPAAVGNANLEMVEFLQSRVKGKILDMGGGMGAYAHALVEKGHSVTLAEKNTECLKEVRKLGIPVVDMNTTSWSDLKGKFETVMLIEVLEHVENYRDFLKNVVDCATDRILLTVPCNDEFQKLFEAGLTYNHIAVTDHLHQFTSKDISSLLNELGCRFKMHTGSHLFPHALLALLYREMWGSFTGKLALSSLKIFHSRRWLPFLFPTRIFVEAYPPGK